MSGGILRGTIVAATCAATLTAAAPAAAAAGSRSYRVETVRTAQERSAVARTGAAIDAVDHSAVIVSATEREVRLLRRRGFRVTAPPTRTSQRCSSPAASTRGSI